MAFSSRFPRTWTAAVAAATLAGALALPAAAQPTGPAAAAQAPAAAQRQAPDFAKLHAERLDRMKTLLQLQPSQQAAWDKYVQAITPEKRAKPAGERQDLRKLTTPERLDRTQQLRKERTAKAEQRDQATRSFYSSLNASQQKAFDELTVHHPGKHRHSGKRMGHQPGPRHGHTSHAAPGA